MLLPGRLMRVVVSDDILHCIPANPDRASAKGVGRHLVDPMLFP